MMSHISILIVINVLCFHKRNLFSWRMISHISSGHWASFSAATICTFMFFVCDLPRDFTKRCRTCEISCWSDTKIRIHETFGEEICR